MICSLILFLAKSKEEQVKKIDQFFHEWVKANRNVVNFREQMSKGEIFHVIVSIISG